MARRKRRESDVQKAQREAAKQFPSFNSGWPVPDPRPTTPRAETQRALASKGLLRKPSQVSNDIEAQKLRKKEIEDSKIEIP